MQTKEDFLYHDFQGWPVFKMNLREIFKTLNMINQDGDVVIKHDDPLLDTYPVTLEDDGMGYGVGEMFISSVDKTNDVIRLWRDVKSDSETFDR